MLRSDVLTSVNTKHHPAIKNIVKPSVQCSIRVRIGSAVRLTALVVGVLLACTSTEAVAQTTATLTGKVLDPAGAAVAGAAVRLENSLTAFGSEVRSNEDGEFTLTNVPFRDYTLTVEKDGFDPVRQQVPLRTNVAHSLEIRLKVRSVQQEISVHGVEDTPELLDVSQTGTRTALTLRAIERMPVAVGTRGLETVIASFPGFAMNANGAIHPRGAHNQMTYVIDGLPIADQLTGSFASSLEPNVVQSIELFTGNVPAEYGSKVSGVANIITKTGLGTGRRFAGSTELNAAGFDTMGNVTQAAGEAGRVGYFGSIFSLKSNRFLDQVSLDNLHNGGDSQRGYARIDYQATDRDVVRLQAMAGRSAFQLANLRSQHANGQDQRQLLRDAAVWVGWVHALSPSATIDALAAYRTSIAQLGSSAGDTPVTADQARHLSTSTVAANLNMIRGSHTLRGGFMWQHIPLSEDFSFGITDPAFNAPGTEGFRESLLPYDLSRGGGRFYFSERGRGNLTGFHLQDTIRAGRFTFALGARYDAYRFLVKGYQFQPRLGIAYLLRETGTVLRASYNRNYQTPPNENLLLSSSQQVAVLAPASVRDALGNVAIRIRPERQDVFEVGLQQALFSRASLNVSYYHKRSHDQQDNDNFLNTGIIFPLTLSKIRVNGAEARLTVPSIRGFSGSLSLTHYRAISTPPFTGGLFLSQGAVDLLAAGPFVIDHDQTLSAQANVVYSAPKNFWASTTIRHDSGLVVNPSDPAEVAADPDYSDLLPYVNLGSTPARARPRTITDVAVGYGRSREGRRMWDAQVQMTNLFDRTAVYSFQSIFVGTRVVQPRTFGVKLRFYF